MRIISTSILLLSSLISLAQNPTDDLWKLYNSQNYITVIEKVTPILKTDSNNVELNLLLGRAYTEVGNYKEAIPYLDFAVKNDSHNSWLKAWAQGYLGTCNFMVEKFDESKRLLKDCINLNATKNATNYAYGKILLFGFDVSYMNWKIVETDHFRFHFQNMTDKEIEKYVALREKAYKDVNLFFKCDLPKRIDFFVWNSMEDAMKILKANLGFARPDFCIVHSYFQQTPGHEITHVISNYTAAFAEKCRFINEGTAVCFDLSYQDKMQTVKDWIKSQNKKIVIKDFWENGKDYSDEILYPLSGLFVKELINCFGREKYLEFFKKQTYLNAKLVFGDKLDNMIQVFENKINNNKFPPITPRWGLEHIVWEDSANNQSSSEKLVSLYLQHKMPVGAIIIDSPWSTAYNNFDWNTARYPNSTEMIQNFNKQNVKVILWLTGCINSTGKDVPVQKHPSFDEVVSKKYAINNGKISNWWKGDGLHIDFTNPDAVKWWNSQLDKILISGVYGFKVDQGEIYFGDTVQTSIGAMTNIDFRPYYYNSMFQYITSRRPEGAIVGRPFSHQGGVEASVEQLSLGWCGDFEGSWSGLKLQIGNIYKSAELGYGAPGCEVGGFFRARSSKIELIRYAQFGALTACMINGGENGAFTNHLPWFHGNEAASCYRQAVWLHSQLIPYFFSTIVNANKFGGSLIKDASYEQESHMAGDYLFTKAITSRNNTVSFKLPKEGKWMDFWSKTISSGGTIITQTYPLNQFPLFIKEGAIIPMNISNSYSGIGDSSLTGKQTIYIVPEKGESSYQYFRPLGDGIEYDSIRISYDGLLNELKVEGKNKLPYAFIITNCSKPIKVKKAYKWKYNEDKQELLLIKNGKKFTIKIEF